MLPTNLKNFNLYADGESLMGVAEEITLPKLTRKMEEFEAAGMAGPVDIDMGNEKMELEWTCAGMAFSAIKREHGVKDYSNLLPGHGGMLDRFDSTIFTAPMLELLVLLAPAIAVVAQ